MNYRPPLVKRYYGISPGCYPYIISEIARTRRRLFVVVPSFRVAEELVAGLTTFVSNDFKTALFPDWNVMPFEEASPPIQITSRRLGIVPMLSLSKSIIISYPEALLQKAISPSDFDRLSMQISVGDHISMEELSLKLSQLGYFSAPLVEDMGFYAKRGNIIDYFPPVSVNPIRVEFFGDRVGDIRVFNTATQRSEQSVGSARLVPVREFSGYVEGDEHKRDLIEEIKAIAKALDTPPSESNAVINSIRYGMYRPGIERFFGLVHKGSNSLLHFLDGSWTVVCIEMDIAVENLKSAFENITQRYEQLKEECRLIPPLESLYVHQSDIHKEIELRDPSYIYGVMVTEGEEKEDKVENVPNIPLHDLSISVKARAGTGRAFQKLYETLRDWLKEGKRIVIVCSKQSGCDRIKDILLSYDLASGPIYKSFNELLEDDFFATNIAFIEGYLEHGFYLPTRNIVFVSENDIFSKRPPPTPQREISEKAIKRFLNRLDGMSPGSFVVHDDYGIGIYRGLVQKSVEGITHDCVQLEYADEQMLYIPVENIPKIHKYVAPEGKTPKLDRISSKSSWARKKRSAEEAIEELAAQLIKLYAHRKYSKGWRFESVGAEDERFAQGFPYLETLGQRKAINDTLSDMASDRIMDRLICGDAGYGKTEVALRAAFKCIQHAKQVAYICPSTILANQHYKVFKERFAEWPVRVEMVSRLRKPKENKHVLKEVLEGKVDIIIGTHRLLQKDVEFSDLGLLIIDEEHLFGVKQKERIRFMKKSVDTLTLTATPIPRTLHMALIGIRDVSIIDTPPPNRVTINTYIAEHKHTLIRDVIKREIARGGQCFVVNNRIDMLEDVAESIRELVPEAEVRIAHGQMDRDSLENVMSDFIDRVFNVLVCTTIVESGLDIPNANTIIVIDAHKFGIAQLYQLRGRVGRSDKQAFAYFLIPHVSKISTKARERLRAVQSLNQHGLSYYLAKKDLEMRGAGNLLGKEQSGFIVSIGLEMYNEMLKKAILRAKGDRKNIADTIEPEVKLPTPVYIPESYVESVEDRLYLYQLMSEISTREDSLDIIRDIEDRYGAAPDNVHNLAKLMVLKSVLQENMVIRADISPSSVILDFSPQAQINVSAVQRIMQEDPDVIKIIPEYSIKLKMEFSSDRILDYADNLGRFLQAISEKN